MVLNIDIEKVEEIKNYYLDIIDNYNGSFTQKEIEDKVITHFPMIGADTVSCVCDRIWLKLCIGLIKPVKDNYYRKLTDKELKEVKELAKEMQKQVNSEINNNEKIIN